MELPDFIAPIVTPYTDDGSAVSEIRIARVVRWHQDRGCKGIVFTSEAGEYFSLSLAERKESLMWVLREAKMPVYVCCSGPTTAVCLDLALDAADSGAVGVVVSPPFSNPLSREEAVSFVTAMRRHVNIPVGFLDPSGHNSSVPKEVEIPGTLGAVPLADHGLEHLAFNPHGSTVEFWVGSGIAHPAALFGTDRAAKMLANWETYRPILQGAIKLGGTFRIARYVLEAEGIETGPPRGPFQRLSQQGRAVVDNILKALG